MLDDMPDTKNAAMLDATTDPTDEGRRLPIIYSHLSDCQAQISICGKVEEVLVDAYCSVLGQVELEVLLASHRRVYWSFAVELFVKAFPGCSLTDRWLNYAPEYRDRYKALLKARKRRIAHDGPKGNPYKMREIDLEQGVKAIKNDDVADLQRILRESVVRTWRDVRHYPSHEELSRLGEMVASAMTFFWHRLNELDVMFEVLNSSPDDAP